MKLKLSSMMSQSALQKLNLKEKVHVRSAIISYSKRVCHRVANVAKASDVTISAPSTVPVIVGPTPVPIVMSNIDASELLAWLPRPLFLQAIRKGLTEIYPK